jgi:hypothetical protein
MSTNGTGGDTQVVGCHLVGHVFPIGEIHDCPLTHAQSLDRQLHLGANFWEMDHDRLAHADFSLASSRFTPEQIPSLVGDRLLEVAAMVLDLTPARAP